VRVVMRRRGDRSWPRLESKKQPNIEIYIKILFLLTTFKDLLFEYHCRFNVYLLIFLFKLHFLYLMHHHTILCILQYYASVNSFMPKPISEGLKSDYHFVFMTRFCFHFFIDLTKKYLKSNAVRNLLR